MIFGKTLQGTALQIDATSDRDDQVLSALSKSIEDKNPLSLDDSIWLMEELEHLSEPSSDKLKTKKEGRPRGSK